MRTASKKVILSLASALYIIMSSTPLYADDTEIFTGKAASSTSAKPNVLFIVDTSGSMGSVDVNVPNGLYDSTKTYTGSCDSSLYYWSNTGTPPDCSTSNQHLKISSFKCDDASSAFSAGGSGYYIGRLARYLASTSGDYWSKLANNTTEYVECAADYGVHGDGVNSSNLYPADQNDGGPWKASNSNAIDWNTTGDAYTIYTANYINYLNNNGPTVWLSRLTIVQHALKNLIDSTSGINAAMMRFDANWGHWFWGANGWDTTGSKGGSFVQPMQDINSSTRVGFKNSIDNLTANGATPLAETLYEAMLYYRGEHVHFGKIASPKNVSSVLDPSDSSRYKSPIKFQCPKNFVVLLTDGQPVYDGDADTLINKGNKGNPYSTDNFLGISSSCAYSADDDCLDDLAEYMFNNDQSATLTDKQNIITYTIGFNANNNIPLSAQKLLKSTAKKGGSTKANGGPGYFEATSANDLAKAFTSIITDISKVSTTFVSPAVSVNAFNRLTNRSDLYFALFRPTINYRWPGNLKKYQLIRAKAGDPSSDLIIADVNGVNAVDPNTGLFTINAQSFWSGSVDGADVEKGGAAEKLPDPANRRVYTYTGADSALLPPQTASITLENANNKLLDANTALTKSLLGLSATASSADRTALIQWARGVDVMDEDGDGSTTDSRQAIGDPLHSEPQLVTYKGTTDANADITLYMTTNEGFLHAIDVKTGLEKFAFIPKDLLPNLPTLKDNSTATARLYGLDGPMTVWHNDLNNDLLVLNTDGTVQTGEHVYIYFGMRRGGRNYYALDVTDRSSPKLKWEIKGGTGDFAELGQTWSKMTHAKIKFNGADKDVLIFGGGYDTNVDSTTLPAADNMGRALYIVDAETGQRLWWASTTSSNADLKLADMKNAIAANVTAFDSTGDGYIDRIYAADMAARIWRFDINDSNTGAANLMTGGMIADLNGTATKVASNKAAANNRHFFSAPDVAYVRQGSQEYLTIAIGSGFRAHPLETTIQDRFYVIRDTNVRNPAKDTNGDAIYTTINESNLYDATKNLVGEGTQTQIDAARQALNTNNGWYIKLNQNDGTFVGEKVLGESVTFNNILIFASFTPITNTSQSNSCAPGKGTSSAWAINLLDAQPVFNFCNNGSLKRCDRKGVLKISGLPPKPRIFFTKDGDVTAFYGTQQLNNVGTNPGAVQLKRPNFYSMDRWNVK